MNIFFGTLIARHKEKGISTYAKAIVEPRPTALYEAKPEALNDPVLDPQSSIYVNTNTDEALSRNMESAFSLRKQNPDISTQSNLLYSNVDKQKRGVEQSNELDNSERIDNSTALLPRQDGIKDLLVPLQNNKYNAKPFLQAQAPIKKDFTRKNSPRDKNELNAQSILHHLKSSDTHHKNIDNGFSISRQASISSGSENADSVQSHTKTSLKDKIEKPLAYSSDNQNTAGSFCEVAPINASSQGVLNIPHWLASMQTSVNQRWQHLNAKLESTQSVVNVTIGCVEVSAVQVSALQMPNSQKKVQNKPSGVMSLSDYLKSRDRAGPV